MDLVSKRSAIDGSQALLSPLLSPGGSFFRTHEHHQHSDNNSFPIIAIAVIGIVATAFLLVSYYVFVIKCCLNWHRIDLLRRFSLSRNRHHEDALMPYYSPARQSRGLDESVIRAIPIFRFEKKAKVRERSFCECAVCLGEFQEEEKLKRIPNCSHVFHIDCIDVWLQNNASCPLCRTSISSNTRSAIGQIIAPSTTPQDPNPHADNLIGVDEDFVVIELGNHHQPTANQDLLGRHVRLSSGEMPAVAQRSISPSQRKSEPPRIGHRKGRKFQKGTSMGDECIGIRGKDDRFAVQPIRRSFSMDSSADRQLYLAVQESLRQQQSHVNEEVVTLSPIEGSSSSRVKRSFFSFGPSRGSILPLYLEP